MNIGDIMRDRALADARQELCELARNSEDLFALVAAIECLKPPAPAVLPIDGNEK